MNKKYISLLTCISFLFLFIFSFIILSQSIKAEDNSSRIKKVISIVFDDSGSMKDDPERWLIASYTMQAYISLLNKDDQLYLTYISNDTSLDREFTNLTNEERQAAINYIREKPFNGQTTNFQAVRNAYDKLVKYDEEHKEDSLNTEYSLIVITDGEFEDVGTNQQAKDTVKDEFQRFLDTKFSNGSTLNLTYLIIGEGAINPELTETDNYHQKAINIQNFNDEFLQIANDISGRFTLTGEDVQLNDKTLTVESEFPLLGVGILVNQSDTDISSIKVNDSTELNYERVNLKDPENGTAYFGTTFLIDNDGSSNIPSGKIVIEFNQSIQKENIRVMFEPALNIGISIKRNGVDLNPDNYEFLRANDVITIEPVIQELGTGLVISKDRLPSSVKYSFSYNYKDQTVTSSEDFTQEEITLQNSPFTITASAYLEGVFNLEKELTLTPLDPISYSLEAEVPDDMKEIPITGLWFFNSEISFYITGDGKKLNTNEAKTMPISFDLTKDVPIESPRIDSENGMTYFKIKHAWPSFLNYSPGEFTVRASTPNGLYKDVTINLVAGPWYIYYPYLILEFLIPLLPAVIILVMIITYIRKKKFMKGAEIQQLILGGDDPDKISSQIFEDDLETTKLRSKFDLNLCNPFKKSQKVIESLTFIPGKKGSNKIYAKIPNDSAEYWYKEGSWKEKKILGTDEVTYTLKRPTKKRQVEPKDDMVELSPGETLLTSNDHGNTYEVYFYTK